MHCSSRMLLFCSSPCSFPSSQTVCELKCKGSLISFVFKDTIDASRAFPCRFSEIRTMLRSKPYRKYLVKWLFPLVSSPAPDPCSQLRAIDGSESPLLEVSFNCGTAAEQWSEGSTVLCNWISKPFSVQTSTKKCEEARQKMLHAALSARCSSAHRVLSSALPECSLKKCRLFCLCHFLCVLGPVLRWWLRLQRA